MSKEEREAYSNAKQMAAGQLENLSTKFKSHEGALFVIGLAGFAIADALEQVAYAISGDIRPDDK